MKTTSVLRIFLFLAFFLRMSTISPARQPAADLRYKFSVGQTNAYRVEIQVRSESGLESTTGNVFLITTQVDTNMIRLSCRARLEVRREAQHGPFGYMGGMYPGGPAILPEGCEVQIDDCGRVLREAGGYPLPIPLGSLIPALLEPLPESPSPHWEFSNQASVMDFPLWLGPSTSFWPSQQFGSPYYMNYGPRQPMASVAVSQHVAYRITAKTPETITIHKQLTLKSLLKNGAAPRVSASSEGDLVFDPAAGLFKSMELQGTTESSTETSSRLATISLKGYLLQGAELDAAAVPPSTLTTPQPLVKLATNELQKLTVDLESSDLATRRQAAARLCRAELESPSPELVQRVASLCTSTDNGIRQSAAIFLKTYGTTNEVPALLKLLKDSDWQARQNAIKGLGRLHDERAIDPLTDEVARGSSPAQQDAYTALVSIGSPAEPAVLELLKERNTETRRQACRILQQIGTSKSIEPLQNLVGDSDPSLSQMAAEALRAINQRQ
jgi:hypothetical protein